MTTTPIAQFTYLLAGAPIFMIEHEHESQGGGGNYFYDWYVDPDQGFFTTREAAQVRLEVLQATEEIARRRVWVRSTYNAWKRRVEDNETIVKQNEALVQAGLPAIGLRYVGDEPTYTPGTRQSAYRITEIEPGS